MIQNPVVYAEEHRPCVDAFNQRDLEQRTADYWEYAEVDALRKSIKDHYLHEQSNRCCYCGNNLRTAHGRVWDVEHIVAKAIRPDFLFEPRNLAVACIDCNVAKADENVLVNRTRKSYPTDSNAFTIVHPHYDAYRDHINVLLDHIYVPRTRKGENTIRACRLLRFCYQEVGWSQQLSGNEPLVRALDKLMGAVDSTAQDAALKEVLLVAQVKVSEQLLS